jgi:hypothetical protein
MVLSHLSSHRTDSTHTQVLSHSILTHDRLNLYPGTVTAVLTHDRQLTTRNSHIRHHTDSIHNQETVTSVLTLVSTHNQEQSHLSSHRLNSQPGTVTSVLTYSNSQPGTVTSVLIVVSTHNQEQSHLSSHRLNSQQRTVTSVLTHTDSIHNQEQSHMSSHSLNSQPGTVTSVRIQVSTRNQVVTSTTRLCHTCTPRQGHVTHRQLATICPHTDSTHNQEQSHLSSHKSQLTTKYSHVTYPLK